MPRLTYLVSVSSMAASGPYWVVKVLKGIWKQPEKPILSKSGWKTCDELLSPADSKAWAAWQSQRVSPRPPLILHHSRIFSGKNTFHVKTILWGTYVLTTDPENSNDRLTLLVKWVPSDKGQQKLKGVTVKKPASKIEGKTPVTPMKAKKAVADSPCTPDRPTSMGIRSPSNTSDRVGFFWTPTTPSDADVYEVRSPPPSGSAAVGP